MLLVEGTSKLCTRFSTEARKVWVNILEYVEVYFARVDLDLRSIFVFTFTHIEGFRVLLRFSKICYGFWCGFHRHLEKLS